MKESFSAIQPIIWYWAACNNYKRRPIVTEEMCQHPQQERQQQQKGGRIKIYMSCNKTSFKKDIFFVCLHKHIQMAESVRIVTLLAFLVKVKHFFPDWLWVRFSVDNILCMHFLKN